ncbi:MAG: ribosomal protein S18-alanine N-acetyltransferase [Deltaproteobacteria bacterium]|nr:ribosomal protein S18-alanine N-acetyltransferase [Candidatus Tharpella sp.]
MKVLGNPLFIFTHATIEDLPEIVAIEQASFSKPWSEESLFSELSSLLSSTIIVKSSCKAIVYGYNCCKIIPPEADLLRIAVRPKRRRCGVDRALLDEMFRFLRLQQVATIYLEVSEVNRSAIALYEKSGFVVVVNRPGYYDDGATAALLLRRDL